MPGPASREGRSSLGSSRLAWTCKGKTRGSTWSPGRVTGHPSFPPPPPNQWGGICLGSRTPPLPHPGSPPSPGRRVGGRGGREFPRGVPGWGREGRGPFTMVAAAAAVPVPASVALPPQQGPALPLPRVPKSEHPGQRPPPPARAGPPPPSFPAPASPARPPRR